MKKKKEKSGKQKKKLWLLILGIFVILVNAFTIYTILLLGPIEEMIRYIIIGVCILIDLIFCFRIRAKRKHKEKKVKLLTTFLILYLILNILVSVVILYLYGNISNLNKTYVTYSSSLITMSNHDIEKIEDFKDSTIGMLSNKNSPDGYIIPKEIIDQYHLDKNNTINEYEDYSTMLAELYAGELDAMFISTDYPSMFSGIEAYKNIKEDTKIIYTKEKKMKKADTAKIETASAGKSITEPFTILLMGVDSTDEGLSANTIANGDSLILITFNPETLNATMLSIPRDSYVPIACWSGQPENKITHAAAYGTDCMMQTIENYFDVTIDYYAKINFRGLVSLVDTLGGIDVEVPQDLCTDNSNREGTVCINAGYQHLNGEQALVLARNRKQLAAGDLDRGLNQQIVVEGIINKLKDMNSVDQVIEVLNTISNNLDTNFTNNQILSFYDLAKDIMNHSLQKDDADLINIEQLFLQGTGQMIYDERSRLVLWDYVPIEESRDDIIQAMKINLGEEEPKMVKEFSFSINEPYEKTITGYGPYNTSSGYALLPDFTGDSQSQAQSWASSHGIRVSFNGSSGYVIAQSYPANKRIDLINGAVTLTLSGGSSMTTKKEETTSSSSSGTGNTSEKNQQKEEAPDKEVPVETPPSDPNKNPEEPSEGGSEQKPSTPIPEEEEKTEAPSE